MHVLAFVIIALAMSSHVHAADLSHRHYRLATPLERTLGLCEIYANKHQMNLDPLSRQANFNFIFNQCMLTEGYVPDDMDSP
jgi:hypothetical protein